MLNDTLMEDEMADLRSQERFARSYQRAYLLHPHSQDPDFPGEDEEVNTAEVSLS